MKKNDIATTTGPLEHICDILRQEHSNEYT
jgi:hypothetical protein